MDQFTLDKIKLLHPRVREEAGHIYSEICDRLKGSAFCRFLFTLRTFAEQDALYAQGRTKPGAIVTKARGGSSYHNFGVAIDIVLVVDTNKDGKYDTAKWDTKTDFDGDKIADWMEVVQVFKEYGWEWGGDWKFTDAPHFQKTFGKSVRELLALYNSKRVDSNNYVIF